MTHRSQVRILNLFIVLTLLSAMFFSVSFALADNQTSVAMLDTGLVVNSKIKQATIIADPEHKEETFDIRAIHMADSLPADFVPTEANTVSSYQSKYPIYIFFEDENDVGILYFYTDATTIIMNPYSDYMFFKLEALTDISGIANWNTSNVTNMCGLFSGAKSLPDALALRNWDTSNVTDMSFMFSNAISLMFVDVSNWNTSNVTNMTSMFQVGNSYMGNGQLREINGLGDLDVSNVQDMTCMFYGAAQMTYYDISRWDVSKVESMNHMFCDNNNLESLDLSHWDVSNIRTIYCMFDDCHSLKSIGDVSQWNTANLIDAGGWLNYATAFVGNNEGILDLSGWNTRNLKAAGEMFLYTQLHSIDLTGWVFDCITNDRWEGAGRGIYYETGNDPEVLRGFGQMFKNTSHLTTVYVSKAGLDSFNAAVEREVNTLDMWTNSKCDGFTVK